MYSLVSLLSSTYPLPAMHSLLVTLHVTEYLISINNLRLCNIAGLQYVRKISLTGIDPRFVRNIVTRPLSLVELHTLDAAERRECSLFTSHSFCPNDSSCILRLNENIHLYPSSCVLFIQELSAMINLR